MIFDDRLDTVLRTPAPGIAAARIRFRQLVDLLGRLPDSQWTDAHVAALAHLDQFAESLPEADCVRIIETATIRSSRLVRHLADRRNRGCRAPRSQRLRPAPSAVRPARVRPHDPRPL